MEFPTANNVPILRGNLLDQIKGNEMIYSRLLMYNLQSYILRSNLVLPETFTGFPLGFKILMLFQRIIPADMTKEESFSCSI